MGNPVSANELDMFKRDHTQTARQYRQNVGGAGTLCSEIQVKQACTEETGAGSV